MAHTVVLHIGAMKSGTSFVQRTLDEHRGVLADQGVLFPGSTWRKQVLGVLDVLGQTRDGKVVPGSPGAWDRLREEMDRWPGTAVVSMEFLGPTPVGDIERVVGSLSPAQVEVVMTARDLGRNVPAMWQEEIKNGAGWWWPDYVEALAGEGDTSRQARKFWRQMNYPRIARRWARVVGSERFTLVTVPHPGAPPRLLWERFCGVVGLDPDLFALSGRRNASLGAASAVVLRALNDSLPQDLTSAHYQRVVKHRLARHGMSARAGSEPAIGFAVPPGSWVEDRADEQIQRLAQLGLRVVGDLEELRPVGTPGVAPTEVSTQAQLEAAVAALAYLVEAWPSP